MSMLSSKKLLPLTILNIMQKYTDEKHTLSQQDIMHILEKEYNMNADRKTIKRNLMDLIDFGYPISYKEIKRNNNIICTDWYFEHNFSSSELLIIIESLIFSKNIPKAHCKQLVKKLSELSSKYFKKTLSHTYTISENNDNNNKQLFYSIDVLDEAIKNHKQVTFKYNSYGTDKKLHPRMDTNGKIRQYVINPYRLVAKNSRYYLICNYDKYDDISHYRVDKITDIALLETSAKPISNRFEIENYLNEHIYMFTGESINIKFRANKTILDDIIDWFGTEINIYNEENENIIVATKSDETSFYKWAIQYCEFVEILEPIQLRNKIKSTLQSAVCKYEEIHQ